MRARNAFTLLEMLVALGVFAIIGVLSSRILMGIVDVSDATAARAAELAALQRAMAVVERDVEQLVRRTVRDEYGDRRPAVAVDGDALLELTRRGWQNPLGAQRSELQRVAYLHRDDKLLRLFWPVLDRGDDTEPIVQVLLDGVEEADFLAHDDENSDHRRWPPRTDDEEIHLAAIEMRLRHRDVGRIVRLYLVPPPDDFLVVRESGNANEADSPQDLLQQPSPMPREEP